MMPRLLRRVHLYLGVFFTPLLLFFVLTGWHQTVTPDRRKGVSDADDWLGRLDRVHVEQYYPSQEAEGYSTKLFRALVVVMSVALVVTVVLGVVLAFRVLKARWAVWLALALGFAVPILTLWLGQRR
ncbi:MAG: hypothetical protein IT581_07055 [Verrucomicrobiales bacterium]|nr:hypothetical protein [Verrucomicrobiales bacterium]